MVRKKAKALTMAGVEGASDQGDQAASGTTAGTGRRTSIGRGKPQAGTSKTGGRVEAVKRKSVSDPPEAPKKGKIMTEQERWDEMKKMMQGLSTQMEGVREDVSDVKKELGAEIQKGRQETEALRDRMDKNDQEFSSKVAAVVAGTAAAAATLC